MKMDGFGIELEMGLRFVFGVVEERKSLLVLRSKECGNGASAGEDVHNRPIRCF